MIDFRSSGPAGGALALLAAALGLFVAVGVVPRYRRLRR
jgi:hypothetical protein